MRRRIYTYEQFNDCVLGESTTIEIHSHHLFKTDEHLWLRFVRTMQLLSSDYDYWYITPAKKVVSITYDECMLLYNFFMYNRGEMEGWSVPGSMTEDKTLRQLFALLDTPYPPENFGAWLLLPRAEWDSLPDKVSQMLITHCN